ncbi:hypothetical protein [Powai lake megavirus]|uniref:Uncharacterized protein n=1 Tax=Powai lake megavirus TaxID=1842663 RepID=A0A167RIU7_9VIRU|nr:hypothetical protein QJ849_gp573 [Powai lake megavirus]ANB50735.1 hypothetical protein [Powai lake megavirus]
MQYTPNTIDFGKILKQVKNTQVNENSLDLKSPKRTLVDVSTDTFIKIIFQEENNYYLFLNYVNALDFYLNYLGNINLIQDGHKPFYEHEDIEVFFKGGNVMNYHFSTMVTDPRIKELFAMYFKKSDFDFSVNIHTLTNNRFNQLKKSLYPYIIEFLKKTTYLFNQYLQDVLNDKLINETVNTNFLTNFKNKNDDKIYEKSLQIVKKFIANPKFDMAKEIIDNYFIMFPINYLPKIKQIVLVGKYVRVNFIDDTFVQFISKTQLYHTHDDEIIDSINDIFNKYNKNILNDFVTNYKKIYLTSKYYASLLYPYHKYLISTIGKHELEYSILIDQLVKYNFSVIKSANFYTKEKINNMIIDIQNTINQLNGVYYEIDSDNAPGPDEYTDPNAFTKYIVMPYNNGQVKLSPGNNFIMYNNFENPKGTEILMLSDSYNKNFKTNLESDLQNIHYVSSNLIIKNISGNRQVLDFDLFRIKFNIIAENIVAKNGLIQPSFKIPSEFIDVSVTTISSSTYNEDHGMFIMPIKLTGIKLPNIEVKSHSYTYFIGDLIRILFTDFNFFPWTKGKYEKRLKRLLLLLYLYDGCHDTRLLEDLKELADKVKHNITDFGSNQINLSKYARSPVYLESFDEYINIFDLVYIDPKYDLIKYPVKLLLIMSEILKSNNALEIINHFRRYLKINPLTSLGSLREDFVKFLDEIINTYNDISPNNSYQNVVKDYPIVYKNNKN